MNPLNRRVARMAAIGVLALSALVIGPAGIAQAATFDVNTTDDSLSDGTCDAVCTLRDAIDASNVSSSAGDVVNIPAGTYDISDGGQLEIYRGGGDLTVNGAGARNTIITIDGSDRVFRITANGDVVVDVTIQGVTITGGGNKWGGGGIANYDQADTTLKNVTVTDNEAGYPCDEEMVQELVAGCDSSAGHGAGIFNSGRLEIVESEISNNTALGDANECDGGEGGGIKNRGYLELTNTTISGNEAEIDDECGNPGLGGGILSDPFGRSPDRSEQDFVTIDMVNVTLANNTAGLGGGIANDLFFSADERKPPPNTIASENTIVADNVATLDDMDVAKATDGVDNCFLYEGAIQSNGNNLESDDSCEFFGAGDLQNTDPQLGALANNGGPTNTQALPVGSPALDRYNGVVASNSAKAVVGCLPNDQRNVTRPQGSACDIGAYELEVVVPPATPPAGAAAAQTAVQPKASSSASGPKSCVTKSARVRISGSNISSVTYSLDGKKIATKKGNKTSVKINAKGLSSGVHRVTAKVAYTSATGAKAQTKRITFSRCARKAVKPKFTG